MGYLGNAPADQAVQIGDGVVDTAQLAADAVTSAKIEDNAVDTEHLADDAIEAAELASDAVVNASVASGAAIATSKLSGALTSVTSSGLGTAAARAAEDTMTDGSNLPDGAAIKTYGDTNWAGGGGKVLQVTQDVMMTLYMAVSASERLDDVTNSYYTAALPNPSITITEENSKILILASIGNVHESGDDPTCNIGLKRWTDGGNAVLCGGDTEGESYTSGGPEFGLLRQTGQAVIDGNETSITFHWIDHPDAAVDAVISYKMVITTLTASGGLNWGGANSPTSMTLLELGS